MSGTYYGLLRTVGKAWPMTAVQRCIAHRMRNVLDKTPKAHPRGGPLPDEQRGTGVGAALGRPL